MKKPEFIKTLKVLNFMDMLDYMEKKHDLDRDDMWAEITEWMNNGTNDTYGVCDLDTEYAEGTIVTYLELLKQEYPEEKDLCFFISW